MHPFSITFITSALRLSASWCGRSFSGAKFLHHGGKLLERDLSISVCVNLLDDIVNSILAQGLTETENLFNFLG
jgi:hypothetical protein